MRLWWEPTRSKRGRPGLWKAPFLPYFDSHTIKALFSLITMNPQSFRNQLSLWLIGVLIFLMIMTPHTYAAFSHTAPGSVYEFVGFFIPFEILGTASLAGFLSQYGDRCWQCVLLGLAALMPCLLVWVLGAGLAWWPLAWWVFLVVFLAGYAVEFIAGPLSHTIDALYTLGTRLRDRRRRPLAMSTQGLSRAPSLRHSYEFTQLSSTPTLNGSPPDVPGTPVQAAVKNVGDIV